MSFASQLLRHRKKCGMTQQEVADKMGITKSAYSAYETGKREPDVEKIKLLAEIFSTTGDELLETGYDMPQVQAVLTAEDSLLLHSFHAADPGTQAAVRKLLDIAPPSAESESAM